MKAMTETTKKRAPCPSWGPARLRAVMRTTGWHPARLARQVGLGRDTVHRHLSTDPDVHRLPDTEAKELYAKAFPHIPTSIWASPEQMKRRKAERIKRAKAKARKAKRLEKKKQAQRDERRA